MTAVMISTPTHRFHPAAARALREARGLTREELGALVEVAGGVVTNWELGLRNPTNKHVFALAGALGVPVAAITNMPTEDS